MNPELQTLIEEIRNAADEAGKTASQYRSDRRPNGTTRALIRVHEEYRAFLGSLAAKLSALDLD